MEQVNLPPSSQGSRESRHLWHLRHLRHLEHLRHLLLLAVAVPAAVVVAAVVVVAVTRGSSHPPSGSSAGGSSTRAHATTQPAVDWYNTSYMMSCGGLAPQPFTVNVQSGKATAPGSSGGYSTYEVHVEAVTQPGALTRDGSPQTAVLLYCSPQPSNFFVEEVQVFKSDGGILGELPPTGTLSPGSSLSPQYDSSQFSISAGQLITGMKFYAPTDSHASGPSIHQVLKWSWDGHQFIHDPFTLSQASPSASCPAVGAGVPAGLGSAVQQQVGNVCGLEIGQVKVDPRDPSWVTFSISPTPGSTVQGGGGIAHEANGSWPVVLTGSSMYWCDPRVPSQVVADFGLSCP